MSLGEKIGTAVSEPSKVSDYLATKLYRLNRSVYNAFARHRRPPTNVFNEDWDNLLILDACQYDLLAQCDLSCDSFEFRYSGGSNSPEFLSFNISGQVLDDVVWVSANPFVHRYRDDIFRVVDAWRDNWDEEQETVLPETMRSLAVDAFDRYPNKRLVVHFMQPHYPFIGEATIRENYGTFVGDGIMFEHAGLDPSSTEDGLWTRVREGHIPVDLVRKAYEANLERVLPSVEALVDVLPGRTVVTADHGNEFDRRIFPVPFRIYGHPREVYTSGLVKVPWVVYEGERRKIRPGQIEDESGVLTDEVSDRLQSLGYTENEMDMLTKS